MKTTLEPSDSSGATKMEVPEKKQYKITPTKTEGVILPPTYAELGIDKGLIKVMPKNEGAKGQLVSRGLIGPTKTEGPINKGKSETPPPTYNENHA